jgi:uncharacterized protein YjdB
MKNLLLLVVFSVFFAATNANAQVGKRWYSYSDYLSFTSSVGFSLMDIWNDTTAVFGYGGASPAYFGNNFVSVGTSFAPRLTAWNDVSLFGSTIKVGPGDIYTIDSVRIFGNYQRNNAKLLPKDTLRLAFVYGNGTLTTNLPGNSLTGGPLLVDYGSDPVYFLQMFHDSTKNIAAKYVGAAAVPYVQSIILSATDTSSNFGRAYALTTPFSIPAGNCASMSFTFKSGDASYTPFDTVRYTSGAYKYGLFNPVIGYEGTAGSPVFAIYDPADSNVGYFKNEGAGDAGWPGLYVPTWAWTAGGGASELQYPVFDFHITCTTCDLNDDITGTLHVCAGSTSALGFSLPGGTWTSSNPSVATIGLATGIAGGVAIGVATITYTLSGHHAYAQFTVDAAPAVIMGTTHVCTGASTTLTDATFPGTWTSGSTGVANVDLITGSVLGMSPGTSIITYTASSGCSATTIVTVTASPAAIGGTMNVCVGFTTALTDATPSGTWTSGSTGIATVGAGSGIVGGVSSGSAIITYTTAGGCYVTASVVVNTAPTAGTVTGASTVCAGSTISLVDGAPGGLWSSSAMVVATVNGAGVVSGVSAGATTISYTVTNSCGSATASAPVTVNPMPDPGTITGAVTDVCPGYSITLADAAPGGVWSSSSTGVATVDASGVVYGVATAGGSAAISYTVSNSCGTLSAVLPVNVVSQGLCALNVKSNSGNYEEVEVYPNPNKGLFAVKLFSDNNQQADITITNLVGEKVKEFTISANKVNDVQLNQAPGIYFLSATTGTGKYVVKVVVE